MTVHTHNNGSNVHLFNPSKLRKLTTHDEEYKGLGGGLRWLVFYKNPRARSAKTRMWSFRSAFVSRVDALILRKNLLESTGPWAKVAILYTDEEPEYWSEILNGGVDISMGPH